MKVFKMFVVAVSLVVGGCFYTFPVAAQDVEESGKDYTSSAPEIALRGCMAL